MRPMDKITVRLRPSAQQGMTRLHLSGLISTRLSGKDVRRLWQPIEQLSEEVCIVLPVDAPLPWFDLWTERLGRASANPLAIRFVDSWRRKIMTGDGEQ